MSTLIKLVHVCSKAVILYDVKKVDLNSMVIYMLLKIINVFLMRFKKRVLFFAKISFFNFALLASSDELIMPENDDDQAIQNFNKEPENIRENHEISEQKLFEKKSKNSDPLPMVQKKSASDVVLTWQDVTQDISNQSLRHFDPRAKRQKQDAKTSQKGLDGLDNNFNKALGRDNTLEDHESASGAISQEKVPVVVTERERSEIKDFVEKQLSEKLPEDQIEIIQEVTNSYLETLFKKLLRRSIKKFLKNTVLMIFRSVNLAQKDNNALTDRDIWVICQKIYEKELAKQMLAKKEYIQKKSLKK